MECHSAAGRDMQARTVERHMRTVVGRMGSLVGIEERMNVKRLEQQQCMVEKLVKSAG